MSGEESLAQINREIEAPKLKNLLRTGFIIFIYSLLLTSLISFFAVMIIPDSVRMSLTATTDRRLGDVRGRAAVAAPRAARVRGVGGIPDPCGRG